MARVADRDHRAYGVKMRWRPASCRFGHKERALTGDPIRPDSAETKREAIRVISFRDHDRVWYRLDETGFNKVGYITQRDSVVHPRWNRGLTESALSRVQRYPHRVFERNVATRAEAENVEAFFTQNMRSVELFNLGLYAIGNASDLSSFENPIRIPILHDISPEEFEKRWAMFSSTLLRGDLVFVFDTTNFISKLITRFDHGTWSHVGVYAGDGKIVEAITPGVVERSIEVYKHPRFRLGLYRIKGLESKSAEFVEVARSGIGSSYDFMGVARLGVLKLLGLKPRMRSGDRNVTPNDIARSEAASLILIV